MTCHVSSGISAMHGMRKAPPLYRVHTSAPNRISPGTPEPSQRIQCSARDDVALRPIPCFRDLREDRSEAGEAGAAMGWFTNLVVVMSCVAGGLVLYPVQITDAGAGERPGVTVSGIVRLVHLLSFATAFGTSVWASFIGGIIMFKNLPRHQFGNLQAKMFPAYFKLLIVCCSLCVSAMATTHPWNTATKRERLQVVALRVSLFTVVVNLLVFQPLTVNIMMQKHKIEKEEGIGSEVGWSKNVETAKKNPELAKINKTFGMVHGFSSLANLFCFGGLAFHSWYIASRMLL